MDICIGNLPMGVTEGDLREGAFLVQSLRDMGYKKVEVHEQAQQLYGYQDDLRPETAEVIIRRQYIGSAANDVGFKRQPSGEFEAIISEFDRRTHCGPSWLKELNRRYAYAVIQDQICEQNLVVEEELTLTNGDVVITLSERG